MIGLQRRLSPVDFLWSMILTKAQLCYQIAIRRSGRLACFMHIVIFSCKTVAFFPRKILCSIPFCEHSCHSLWLFSCALSPNESRDRQRYLFLLPSINRVPIVVHPNIPYSPIKNKQLRMRDVWYGALALFVPSNRVALVSSKSGRRLEIEKIYGSIY